MSIKAEIEALKRRFGSIALPRCTVIFKDDEPAPLFTGSDVPPCREGPKALEQCLSCRRVKAENKTIARTLTRTEGPDRGPEDHGPRCHLFVTRTEGGAVLECYGCTRDGRDEWEPLTALPDCRSCTIARRTVTDTALLAVGTDLVEG